jgi:demethylmenaquinone methyltransferase / 2-methoxy-6-polyprenyl-1,4-benzoquinol methylase
MTSPLPVGAEKVATVRSMFDRIAQNYDRTNKVMTFGLDIAWRKRSMRYLSLGPNSLIADIACGTGDYLRLLEAKGHNAIGVDLSMGMLENARTESPMIQADATALPFADASLDGITSGFSLRNFADLNALYAELARVVRPGGRILLLDAYRPTNPVLRFGHNIYFSRVVPRIGALLSDADAYRYLPQSLGYLPEPEQMITDIEAAGFRAVQRRVFSGEIVHLFSATRQ